MPPEPYTPWEVLSLYRAAAPTLCGLLESRADAGPARPFLLFQGRACSYGQALDCVGTLAASLASRGIRKGDRVAMMAANSDVFVLLLFALSRVGAIAVPMNPELNAAEAGYIFRHAEVSAVACSAAALPAAHAAGGELPHKPWFILLDGAAAAGAWDSRPVALDELMRSPGNGDQPMAGPQDIFLTLYTSGTTGIPKGVMHCQKNFVVAGEAFVERMHLQPEDRLFVILPFFHINALFYSLGGAMAAGAAPLIAPRFTPLGTSAHGRRGRGHRSEHHRCGGEYLKRRPKSEFVPGHRLRKIYGAGMTAETLEVFPREFGVPTLIEGYGLTEVPGVSNNPFAGPHKAGSMGPPSRHPDRSRTFSEMRVLDDDGRELPDGQTGEIAIKSPITMQGYYRDPEATAAAFRDGWFLTGDMGYRDGDGYYYFVTRRRISSAGAARISPARKSIRWSRRIPRCSRPRRLPCPVNWAKMKSWWWRCRGRGRC